MSIGVAEHSARFCLQRLVMLLRFCGMRRSAVRAAPRVRVHISRRTIHSARLAAVDYEALRLQARSVFASKIEEVRGSIGRMQKAQRAAEQALDMCVASSPIVPPMPAELFVATCSACCRYERSCVSSAAA